MVAEPTRWARVEVDAGAIRHNVGLLGRVAHPAEIWVVVKADAYGHGASVATAAARAAGAPAVCVALVEEGLALRAAGDDGRIVVLSEQPPEQILGAVSGGLELTVGSAKGVEAAARAGREVRVHLEVDTGMHRSGCEAGEVASLVQRITDHPNLSLVGISTHLARADDPSDGRTSSQLRLLDSVLGVLADAGSGIPLVHAANSAGALAHPVARRDAVRVGIAAYGLAPGPGVADQCRGLRPALRLTARVSAVRRVGAGLGVSYGRNCDPYRDATVATLPLGYADGVPRRLSAAGGEVLLGGRRRPMVGVVTMDQLMIDCGDDDVAVGDEAVLLGGQGADRIAADEWADRLGTIAYEVIAGLRHRLPRVPSGQPWSGPLRIHQTRGEALT